MPRVSFDTKADFDKAYRINAEPEGHPSGRAPVRLGYCRAVAMAYNRTTIHNLIRIFNWPTTTKIVIVGAGFGWSVEILENEHGFTHVVGTDTSPWIIGNQNRGEDEDIDEAIRAAGLNPGQGEGLEKRNRIRSAGARRRCSRSIKNETLLNQGSRNRVKNSIGGVDVAISEQVISCLDDSEAIALSTAMHALDAVVEVVHVTTELNQEKLDVGCQDPEYNWKALEGWKALLPNDLIVSANTWRTI